MRIFLSGPAGSGKTTAGRALARRLGVRFVDLDARLEEREGQTVAQLFAARGEPAFRAIERAEARALLDDPSPAVVAFGGGTLVDRETRRRALDAGTVLTLEAPVATLAARARAQGATRPLLAGDDPAAVLQRLITERADAYAECHARIETGELTPEDVAARCEEVVRRAPICVPLGARTYVVDVGPGVRRRAVEALGASRVLLVTDEAVGPLWARALREALPGVLTEVVLARGETSKHLGSIEQIWNAALNAHLDRKTVVLAIGGGVVGDLAGFAAATLLRGVPFAQVPTTLLAMVDASVGGKTGFDRPEGKNLIGAFHQPRFVLCDPETLSTLDDAERRSGLAEVLKCAWIAGERELAALERDADALLRGELDATVRAIRMSVALKARIVADDEHETGARALLNLGHTIGHAIEAAQGFGGMRHGECVGLGLVCAHRVARSLGVGSAADEARTVALLERLGLPSDPSPYLDANTLAYVGSDKKRVGASVRFLAPAAPGDVRIAELEVASLERRVRG